MFCMKSKRIKAKVLTALVVLLIRAVGAYTVHADHKDGQNDSAQWYVGVNDVRAVPSSQITNSYHYYWFQALSTWSVWGRWEFAHKIREG